MSEIKAPPDCIFTGLWASAQYFMLAIIKNINYAPGPVNSRCSTAPCQQMWRPPYITKAVLCVRQSELLQSLFAEDQSSSKSQHVKCLNCILLNKWNPIFSPPNEGCAMCHILHTICLLGSSAGRVTVLASCFPGFISATLIIQYWTT